MSPGLSRNSLKLQTVNQNCPHIPYIQPCKHKAARAGLHTHKTHISLLRHMTVATKCTSFCSSQGLVRAPVNWEAILIFPLFMLWLWDYPFSHSFLKTTWDSSFPFSLFFPFSITPPPTPTFPPTHTHTHTLQPAQQLHPPLFHSQVPPWPWKL